jgi:hypothetical protein
LALQVEASYQFVSNVNMTYCFKKKEHSYL